MRPLLYRFAGFLESAPLVLAEETQRTFDVGIERGGELDAAGRPKHELLRHAVRRGWLLHGSQRDVAVFDPRDQSDFDGRPVRAVFATDDGIWPMFFAVVARRSPMSMINTCIHSRGRSYYYFSLSTDPREPDSWTDGWVYLLSSRTFVRHPRHPEWTSPVAVRPHARLSVSPDDFPFREAVLRHRLGEQPPRVVLRYVFRRPGSLVHAV